MGQPFACGQHFGRPVYYSLAFILGTLLAVIEHPASRMVKPNPDKPELNIED